MRTRTKGRLLPNRAEILTETPPQSRMTDLLEWFSNELGLEVLLAKSGGYVTVSLEQAFRR